MELKVLSYMRAYRTWFLQTLKAGQDPCVIRPVAVNEITSLIGVSDRNRWGLCAYGFAELGPCSTASTGSGTDGDRGAVIA